MKNGFFQLVKTENGFGIKIFPPVDGGEEIRLDELLGYLKVRDLSCAIPSLKNAIAEKEVTVIPLGEGDCPEVEEFYELQVSEDLMSATVRFYPPSETGKRITMEAFIRDLRFRKVVAGIQMQELQEHFQTGIYCTDILVAQGRVPRHGTDAKIEYFFNIDIHIHPSMREDGSVDFFNLNTINHCKKGDVLAQITPEDAGEHGLNIQGGRIKPRDVKKAVFKYSHNIELSEDRMTIRSMVDGHVMLVEDKVFVNDIFMVENVDNSTGNIIFEGGVQINGNVQTNFKVSAKGNVVVNGVVEGAYIEAGGDIIIARGMNGMGKGTLKAGGNIVARFLENVSASAEGYVTAGSILHSQVMAGTEVEVNGKRGFIAGGHVSAGRKITVKTLGTEMGTATTVEVGVSPQIKQQYQLLQKEIGEIVKVIKNAQPVLAAFTEKRAKGVRITDDQVKYVKDAAKLLEVKKAELETKNAQLHEVQSKIDTQVRAVIEVKDVVYAGTYVAIGDVSMIVQSSYKYCKFERSQGEVKVMPI